MEQHKLLVTWTVSAVVYYPGETLDDAIQEALDDPNLPDGEYVDGSFDVEPAEQLEASLSEIAPLRPRVAMPEHLQAIENDMLSDEQLKLLYANEEDEDD
jgi:hypothetical protein